MWRHCQHIQMKTIVILVIHVPNNRREIVIRLEGRRREEGREEEGGEGNPVS